MVYGTSYCSVDNQTVLKTLGCADSKALTEKTRDDIFDGITEQAEILGWAVHIISPTTISNCSFMRYTQRAPHDLYTWGYLSIIVALCDSCGRFINRKT